MRCSCAGDFTTHPGGGPYSASHSFEWACAATGTYFIEVASNCDIPYYAATEMCSQRSDEEWTCTTPDAQECSSAARLQIDVLDTSTTITDHSLHPVSPEIFTPGSEAEAQFATMFSGTQHPAISYVTEIIPVGLGNCGGSPPCLNGGECVEMPALDIAPATEEDTQNLLAMFADKQQPYTRHSVETYRCECPPSRTRPRGRPRLPSARTRRARRPARRCLG